MFDEVMDKVGIGVTVTKNFKRLSKGLVQC